MLLKPSAKVAECYRKAAEARERADATAHDSVRVDFLDIEQRWLNLARSYEYSERLDRLVGEFERRKDQV